MNKLTQIIVTCVFMTIGWLPVAHAEYSGDCSNAENDIKRLEAEKKATAERVAKGVMTIMPIGLAFSAVRGKTDENIEIASGHYDDMIDESIAKIKTKCGL